jgi:hypothetical protein
VPTKCADSLRPFAHPSTTPTLMPAQRAPGSGKRNRVPRQSSSERETRREGHASTPRCGARNARAAGAVHATLTGRGLEAPQSRILLEAGVQRRCFVSHCPETNFCFFTVKTRSRTPLTNSSCEKIKIEPTLSLGVRLAAAHFFCLAQLTSFPSPPPLLPPVRLRGSPAQTN